MPPKRKNKQGQCGQQGGGWFTCWVVDPGERRERVEEEMETDSNEPEEESFADAGGERKGIASRLGAIPRPLWMEGVIRSFTFMFTMLGIFFRYIWSQPRILPSNMVLKLKDQSFCESVVAINKIAAEEALEVIKKLGGYYIKAAQTMCGARVLPEGFDEVFAVLLDDCPRQPFEVIKGIIEAELSMDLYDIFDEFEEEAVAAASIGQVHFAKLKNGTRVAVKVQYPSVERFFTMDVRTVGLMMTLAGMKSQVQQVFATMEKQLEAEFDYRAEAANMREVADAIMPVYSGRIAIPAPIDEAYMKGAACSPGVSLCTRKVLTMELLEGKPIRRQTMEMMRIVSKWLKIDFKDVRELMTTEDPDKVDALLKKNRSIKAFVSRGPTTQCESITMKAAVRARNWAAALSSRLAGSCAGPATEVQEMPVPLNGPKLAKLLFDVHGYEIFQLGLFNSDPHAGNVLVMENECLGLIDYGACMRLDETTRTEVAKLFVAIATEDDDSVPRAFWALGFRSRKQDWRLALLLAHLSFNRGPFPADMNRLAPIIGMPENPTLRDLDKYTRGGKFDDILEFPGVLVMLQRCCMVLSGIGIEIGAGRLSAAGMFLPQAQRWLAQQQ
mmetsp:Transcript_6749/g.16461  ORF Transcript_6749/g.16461 Transcript_6749/m.16461 type:complete len:613 (+) Transcript_6749:84-1922(+)